MTNTTKPGCQIKAEQIAPSLPRDKHGKIDIGSLVGQWFSDFTIKQPGIDYALDIVIPSVIAIQMESRAPQWQPIETAPMDRLIIVAASGTNSWETGVYDSGGGLCDVDYHERSMSGDVDVVKYSIDGSAFYVFGLEFSSDGYLVSRYNSGEISGQEAKEDWTVRLSHWMPLPTPPKDGGDE